MQPNTQRPVLVLMRGLPGSGKSFLSAALQQSIGKHHVVLLDPDAIDYNSEDYHEFIQKLKSENVDEKLFPYRYLRSKAYAAAREQKIVIWNQAFTNADLVERTIDNIVMNAGSEGVDLAGCIVELSIDLETAKRRIAERVNAGLHDVSDTAYERFLADFAPMQTSKYLIVRIDGTRDVTELVDEIQKALATFAKK